MKVIVNTEVLKGLIAKATKGVGDNKLIPITQLIGIEKSDVELTLITTDSNNYLYTSTKLDDADEFSVTVYADQFSKLISKMTSEYTTLEVKDGTLEVKGNGTYTIELPLDENGELIKYPNPLEEAGSVDTETTTASLSMVRTMLESLKGSLATTMEYPAITQYYAGDTVMTTNRYTVTEIDNRFCDEDMLISPECLDLLDNMTDETININYNDAFVIFKGTGCTVYSRRNMDIADYPKDTLSTLLSADFEHICHIDKVEMLNLLDRMTLFASDVTKKLAPVKLKFDKEGITVSNKSGKSNEFIAYKDRNSDVEFECWVNIALLTAQIKAYAGDVIEIHYGNEKLIKFVDGSITYIIALTINA